MIAKSPALTLCAALFSYTVQAAEHTAIIDWSGRVTLSLPVSGVLDNVTAQAGQIIKKGELLASLDATLFKAAVAESRADLDRLTEEEADAKRDLDRVQELYARTVSATTELDAAKLRHARAQAGLTAAQARAERARRLLADSELRAPFDSIVLSRQAEPGLVVASQCQPPALFSVARADEISARALIDAAQASAVRLGQEAVVIFGGKSLKGRIRALSASGEGNYSVEVVLPRNAGLLGGLPAKIRLP